MIQTGSIVKLAPKWSRPEERHLLYGVREYYEDIGRCEIMCLCGESYFKSIETVDLEMTVDTGLMVEKDILLFAV